MHPLAVENCEELIKNIFKHKNILKFSGCHVIEIRGEEQCNISNF